MFTNGFEILEFIVDEFPGNPTQNIRGQRIESEDSVIEFSEPCDKFRHPELVVETLNGCGNFAFHA